MMNTRWDENDDFGLRKTMDSIVRLTRSRCLLRHCMLLGSCHDRKSVTAQ
jgi:hypothetical protein